MKLEQKFAGPSERVSFIIAYLCQNFHRKIGKPNQKNGGCRRFFLPILV
jgi:hypothetical protein